MKPFAAAAIKRKRPSLSSFVFSLASLVSLTLLSIKRGGEKERERERESERRERERQRAREPRKIFCFWKGGERYKEIFAIRLSILLIESPLAELLLVN